MVKLNRKSLTVGLATVSALAAVAGSASASFASPAPAPLKLTVYDKNTGSPFTDPVARYITQKTGVFLQVEQPSGDPNVKLNLILASGDLPDIIKMDAGQTIAPKFLAAGDLIPLDDLINKYAPDLKKIYGSTLDEVRQADGHIYWLPNWYGPVNDPVFGVLMRKDLLKQLGVGDQYENAKPFTSAQFEQLLVKFKQKFPTINGHPTIPMTLNGAGNWGSVIGTFEGMFGIPGYYGNSKSLKLNVEDPNFLPMLLYLNELYRKGLIDPEWATVQTTQWNQKLSAGNVFATTGAYWDPGSANQALSKDPNGIKQFYSYLVTGPGITPAKTTYSYRNSLGWDDIAITKHDPDPVKTMKMFNYLASEEGQYLLMWGLPNVDWKIVNGKHVENPSIVNTLKKGGNVNNTGIRQWLYFINNGKGSDGTEYNMMDQYLSGATTVEARKNFADAPVYDSAPFSNLGPEAGTPLALKQSTINNAINAALPKIINASSKAEATAQFNTLMAQLKSDGIAQLDQLITQQYAQELKQWHMQ